jgi:hypothetical protein
MSISYPFWQLLGLVIAGIVAGSGLMILIFSLLANLSGDETSVGCASISGVMLLAAAGYIAIRALSA